MHPVHAVVIPWGTNYVADALSSVVYVVRPMFPGAVGASIVVSDHETRLSPVAGETNRSKSKVVGQARSREDCKVLYNVSFVARHVEVLIVQPDGEARGIVNEKIVSVVVSAELLR